MTLAQIRNRIHALQRRFGLPLAIIRLRPYATQFCHQWATAQDRKQPLPETPVFIRKLADAGFRLTTFMYLHHHIKRHLSNNTCPNPKGIISALLPHAAAREGIIDAVFPVGPCSPGLRSRNHSQRTHALLQQAISFHPVRPCDRTNPLTAAIRCVRYHQVAMHSPRSYNCRQSFAGPRANQIHF